MYTLMHDLIEGFPGHLEHALKIGRSATLAPHSSAVKSVVITGLGGSGIGGRIAGQLVADNATCPIEVYNNYYLPAHVGKGTLVIACSYSGNTEETLAATHQALENGATVAAITSGGSLLELAQEKGLHHIVIPGGNPPRTMLAYSLVQQFFLLKHFGVIDMSFEESIAASAKQLVAEKESIDGKAKDLANALFGKRVVIYSEASTEAVAVRFRQQLNENSKELCWHHAIPEMNHNELVGWAGGSADLAVVLFRHKSDHERSQVRMEINKTIFEKYTSSIHEVWSTGIDALAQQLYLIHLGDRVSYHLAVRKGVDPVEIGVINMLKDKLAEVK